MRTVAILGGGIGGIATASVLLRGGWDVRVYERSPTCSGNGTGFLLLDNGIGALASLGLDAALEVGRRLTRCELVNLDGSLLRALDVEAYGFYHPRFVEALMGAVPLERVRWGHHVAGLEQAATGRITCAILASGQRIEADVFIACDGNRSACRNSLRPGTTLGTDLVHELVCRLEAPDLVEQLGGRFIKVHDPDQPLSVGLAPCGDRDLVWFIQASRDILSPRSTDHTVRQTLASRLLEGWPGFITELVTRSDFARSYHWRTADLDPLPNLAWENAALLGDAAHPMLTFTSQGVASALTDAIVLGQLLNEAPRTQAGVAQALQAYSDKRLPEVSRIQEHGRHLRENFLARRTDGPEIEVPLTLIPSAEAETLSRAR
jgi:2-polyprenyl-6-methoxyphenol hydroxylase-like FAD-dependent oxidoreductase